jgi:hypothetical protein
MVAEKIIQYIGIDTIIDTIVIGGECIKSKPFPDLCVLYGFVEIIPASYITKIYGCNEYVGITPEMNLQGYAYSGGAYPGVAFSMDGATGQLKYTSTYITGGSPFTMKYLLTKL